PGGAQRGEPAATEQRVDFDLGAQEAAQGGERVDGEAGGQHLLAVAGAQLRVEPAVVLEQLGDRGRVLLRPQVGVVARSVPAGEGVGEVRRAVAGRDDRVEAGSGEDL